MYRVFPQYYGVLCNKKRCCAAIAAAMLPAELLSTVQSFESRQSSLSRTIQVNRSAENRTKPPTKAFRDDALLSLYLRGMSCNFPLITTCSIAFGVFYCTAQSLSAVDRIGDCTSIPYFITNNLYDYGKATWGLHMRIIIILSFIKVTLS